MESKTLKRKRDPPIKGLIALSEDVLAYILSFLLIPEHGGLRRVCKLLNRISCRRADAWCPIWFTQWDNLLLHLPKNAHFKHVLARDVSRASMRNPWWYQAHHFVQTETIDVFDMPPISFLAHSSQTLHTVHISYKTQDADSVIKLFLSGQTEWPSLHSLHLWDSFGSPKISQHMRHLKQIPPSLVSLMLQGDAEWPCFMDNLASALARSNVNDLNLMSWDMSREHFQLLAPSLRKIKCLNLDTVTDEMLLSLEDKDIPQLDTLTLNNHQITVQVLQRFMSRITTLHLDGDATALGNIDSKSGSSGSSTITCLRVVPWDQDAMEIIFTHLPMLAYSVRQVEVDGLDEKEQCAGFLRCLLTRFPDLELLKLGRNNHSFLLEMQTMKQGSSRHHPKQQKEGTTCLSCKRMEDMDEFRDLNGQLAKFVSVMRF